MANSDHTTSTGHRLANAEWTNAHFELARPEYEDALRWVGVKPGWRVLDAGCGGGDYLPLLCDQVGQAGSVTALDLAPENIAHIEERARVEPGLTNLQAKVGSILDLPFSDGSFDCVWSANVFQYLTKDEIAHALAEFQRVVKRGGIVAVKDYDATLLCLHPMDSGMFARWSLARRADFDARGVAGPYCGLTLPTHLRCAGLLDVRRRGWLVDRYMDSVAETTRRFMQDGLRLRGKNAASLGLSAEDIAAWQTLCEQPGSLTDHPDFCWREGFVVAVGRTPG